MLPPIVCEWELTRRCNLACPHCSAGAGDAHPRELGSDELLGVASALAALGCRSVTLTGGEPLIRPDWEPVATRLRDLGVAVSVHSNGWALDTAMAMRLREAQVREVVVSLDGTAPLHDRVRVRRGAHARAVAALAALREAGVPVAVTTTIFGETVDELERIHDALVALEVPRWHLLLARPPHAGLRPGMRCGWLRPEQHPRMLRILQQLQRGPLALLFGDNLGWHARPCPAGTQSVAVDATGLVKGCLAMPPQAPFVAGSLRHRSLLSIWQDPEAFPSTRLAHRDRPGGCSACARVEQCRGGCHWARDFRVAPGDNRLCRYHPHATRRFRPATAAAAVGIGLIAAGCGASSSGASHPGAPPDMWDCNAAMAVRPEQTGECKTLYQDVGDCIHLVCYSRALHPPGSFPQCDAAWKRFRDSCAR